MANLSPSGNQKILSGATSDCSILIKRPGKFRGWSAPATATAISAGEADCLSLFSSMLATASVSLGVKVCFFCSPWLSSAELTLVRCMISSVLFWLEREWIISMNWFYFCRTNYKRFALHHSHSTYSTPSIIHAIIHYHQTVARGTPKVLDSGGARGSAPSTLAPALPESASGTVSGATPRASIRKFCSDTVEAYKH